ncbi:response regulator [Maridesulfovibrio sp.]|uniref:response regulator n=1 Tax=Maridesulfovibrio sp. TaxID=2795000 RepID=UPI002A1887B8|nr:response regulator [Maridesulfovibrio sp.]
MGRSKNILFVDEDKAQLQLLEKLIEPLQKRWKVCFASNAEEVMDQLMTRPFDIVATELHMEGFADGELLHEIKSRQPGSIRFITSAEVQAENFLQYINSAHQFISKPYVPSEFLSKIKKSMRLKNIFLNERAAKAIASIDELPSLPDLYFRLEKALRKEDVFIGELGRIIGEDMSMSAGLLKIVNSPVFGLFSKVTNPEQAVTLLGLDALKGIVMGLSMFNSADLKGLDFSIAELGEHCQYTGLLGRAIVRSEDACNELCENTFLAGFLHDIGKLVLATSYPDEYRMILGLVREDAVSIQDAEKDILGFTHAEVGAYLLAIWGFNEDVVEAVYCHHDLSKLGSTDLSPAVAVHVANTFDHELRFPCQKCAPHLLDARWLEIHGFSPSLVGWLSVCAEHLEQLPGTD